MSRRIWISAAITGLVVLALPAVSLAGTTALDSKTLTINAPVAAAISINKLADGTGTLVSAFALPETAPGGVSAASAPYHVILTSTSAKWQISAAVTSTFSAAGGLTLPNSAILINGAAQGVSWVGLDTAPVLETPIAKAITSSSDFTFKLSPPAGADSGSYSGVVTITAATL